MFTFILPVEKKADGSSLLRAGFNAQLCADEFGALMHAHQSEVTVNGHIGNTGGNFKADAIILHLCPK